MRRQLFTAALALVSFIAQAQLPNLSVGQVSTTSGAQTLIGQRYRALRNSGASGDKELFLGATDLGVAANRAERDLTYGANAIQFTIIYDPTTNSLTSTTQIDGTPYNLARTNISQSVVDAGKTANLAAMNFFELLVRTGNGASTVTLSDLTLDGVTIPGTYERANSSGTSYWNLREYSFGSGFTLSGTLTLSGSFSSSVEANRIEFSFGVAPSAGTLPVSWGAFNGRKIATGKNLLEWSTFTESNSRHFIVERSSDGKDFKSIGTVNAAGNSDRENKYSFVDASASEGAYYRLLQEDFDGKASYSKIVFVRNSTSPKTAFVMNGNGLYLSFSSTGSKQVSVLDLNGRELIRKNASGSNLNVSLADQPAGIYVVQIIHSNNERETFKIRR